MKKVSTILIFINLLFSTYFYAQDKFPLILNFSVENEVISKTDETIGIEENYNFLMLNPQKAIDLRKYGGKECEFKIVGSKIDRIILEFTKPSKLIPKGMCASGLEKGFLFLEFDENTNLLQSKIYLIESCLLSIENIEQKADKGVIKYLCENYLNSESYVINIDINNLIITKKEKD